MWAAMSDSSSLRAEESYPQLLPPVAIRWQNHKTEAGWITELLQEGHLTWNISQAHSESKKYTFVVLGSCDVGLVWYHTKAQPNWQNQLGGHPIGTKNPSKIKFSTYFHLNPEKPTYFLFWLTPENLKFCPSPLHPQAWMKKLHRSSLRNIDGDESLKQSQMNFNKLDLKKITEIIKRPPEKKKKKHLFWGVEKAQSRSWRCTQIYNFETFPLS